MFIDYSDLSFSWVCVVLSSAFSLGSGFIFGFLSGPLSTVGLALFLKKVIRECLGHDFLHHDLQFIMFDHSVTFTYVVFSHFFVCSIMFREVMSIGNYYGIWLQFILVCDSYCNSRRCCHFHRGIKEYFSL